jgi:hypothetical protein
MQRNARPRRPWNVDQPTEFDEFVRARGIALYRYGYVLAGQSTKPKEYWVLNLAALP